MDCGGAPGCQIVSSYARSYTVGWSAGVTAYEWINAGFSVEQSVETGTAYGCDGKTGDFFSMWKNQGQTAYTVRNIISNCGAVSDDGGDYVMWSPNSQDRDGYYYCVYGRSYCRAQGDRWLDTNGRAGGP